MRRTRRKFAAEIDASCAIFSRLLFRLARRGQQRRFRTSSALAGSFSRASGMAAQPARSCARIGKARMVHLR